MILSDGNISLEKYFENEIRHIHTQLNEIKALISERNLRGFQIEEMQRELETRVHDIEVSVKLVKRAMTGAWGILAAIAIAWLVKVLGL